MAIARIMTRSVTVRVAALTAVAIVGLSVASCSSAADVGSTSAAQSQVQRSSSPGPAGPSTPAGSSSSAPTGSASLGVTAASGDTSGKSNSAQLDAVHTKIDALTKNDNLAAQVPQYFRDRGKLVVAARSAAPYFVVQPGSSYSGLNVDLNTAIGELLDLKIEYLETTSDATVPGLQAKRLDLSAPMGDFLERQVQVDFVDYAKSEISALSKASEDLNISSSAQLCGMTLAYEQGAATEHTVAKIAANCKAAGQKEPTSNAYPDKNAAVLAVQSGRVDLLLAPFAANAQVSNKDPKTFVSQPLSDALTLPGGGAVYGMATTKGGGLDKAVLACMKELVADGIYNDLFAAYGIAQAQLTPAQIVINGGSAQVK